MKFVPPCWGAPPDALKLGSEEIHVWSAAVDCEGAHQEGLRQLLSADELARAQRFRYDDDRREFIVARGLLRLMLGRYLDREPAALVFSGGPRGKPALSTERGGATVRFNVAHSWGRILYAFARERDVGVDLERICPDWAVEDLAARFFSLRENAKLRALPAAQRREAFFACWTRKEAFVKAKGDGLSQPLDGFDVSLAPDEPAALLDSRIDSLDVYRWSIRQVPPLPGYACAVAGEGLNWELKCWARTGQSKTGLTPRNQ